MKIVISVCIITMLCFALCCSQLVDPDCHGNTTKGGYTPCQKRCDNLGHPPSVLRERRRLSFINHDRILLDCRHIKKKYL
ncbi:hypothetical protein CEXT_244781 [Caerostris extrusa]|uniref:Uncharacterized protein n=1 Tax=Caerostris extrusa TaxID=172846 RepID=A0AAV4NFM5_CAEEX|nr:hypothetical protein CEXT_244781 [Caerostris extrusa]